MGKEANYNSSIASHYAAYRPPLHEHILKQCLGERHFESGLDIGCGMGHSSVALSKWCEDVTGIEPSKDMLACAIASPGICYRALSSGFLPFAEDTFDIITFAGSWYYARSQVMAKETYRLTQPNGVILCYDFAVDLGEIERYFKRKSNPVAYDHTSNLDQYNDIPLQKINQKEQSHSLQIQPNELAHLLLAEQGWHNYLPALDTCELIRVIEESSISNILPCTLYFTHYIKAKKVRP